MMATLPLGVATVAMALTVLVIAYHDLKALRIPNWTVLVIIGIYLVTGAWGLPLDVFLWHALYGVVVLFVGFGIYMLSMGNIGGGDIKMMAALAPFIMNLRDLGFVLIAFALISVVGLILFKIARRFVPAAETGWAAFDQKRFFPAGLLLGFTMMFFLIYRLAERLAA